jgi:hypothetical protein
MKRHVADIKGEELVCNAARTLIHLDVFSALC